MDAVLNIAVPLLATVLFIELVVRTITAMRHHKRTSSADRSARTLGELILVVAVESLVLGTLSSIGGLLIVVTLVTLLVHNSAQLLAQASIIGVIFGAPCLFLLVIWSVTPPIVVLERPGRLRALRRSRRLVKGNRWRVLAVILIIMAGVVLLAGVAWEGITMLGGNGNLGAKLVGAIVGSPLWVIAATELYAELHKRSADPLLTEQR